MHSWLFPSHHRGDAIFFKKKETREYKMESPLTAMQQMLVTVMREYLEDPDGAMRPLVLVKYRKHVPLFRLIRPSDQSICCVFYRRLREKQWVIEDGRALDEQTQTGGPHQIQYSMEPALSRPGISTGLFHALNRLEPRLIAHTEIHYNTRSSAQESFNQWLKDSYSPLIRLALLSASRRTRHKTILSIRTNKDDVAGPAKEPHSLTIHEDCCIDALRSRIVDGFHSHTIIVVCVDSRSRRSECALLRKLDADGQLYRLFQCEKEPKICMDFAECDAMLQYLHETREPLDARLLDAFRAPPLPKIDQGVLFLEQRTEKKEARLLNLMMQSSDDDL